MSKETIRTLLRQTRLMDRLERSFMLDIRREKNRFVEAQADHYKRARRLSDDLLLEHRQNLKNMFRKHHKRVIQIFAGDTLRNFPSAKSYQVPEKKRDVFTNLFMEWVNEEGADKVKDIAETTYADLRRVLLAALAAQEPAQIVVKKLLTVRSLSIFRARTIARTETHNAAMFASKRTAQILADDVQLTIVKRWIPALDERTRFSHRAMNSHKPVDMDGKFKVSRASGGFDMMDRPGDPNASAGNVINCRCVMVYEEKE